MNFFHAIIDISCKSRMIKIALKSALLLSLLVLVFSGRANADEYLFPLKISPNSRYLVDQNDTPFFLNGDTPWSLIAEVSKEDAVAYLDNRQAKGFNTILVNLLEHKFATNAPSNFYGDAPFTGEAFVTPNEDYFAHADYVIQEAWDRGLVVFLAPLYLGYNCGDEGWCSEVDTDYTSLADMRSWGQYVGNRYKDYGNIVWVIGGDTDPTPVKEKVQEFAAGILDNDTNHLFTAHNSPASTALGPWSGEGWLTVNNVYTYDLTIYQECKTAYDLSPVMPFFMIESKYENSPGTSQQRIRQQAYWPALSGAFGHLLGNCPLWGLGNSIVVSWCADQTVTWSSAMDEQGSLSMMHFGDLFESRDWHKLIPDFNKDIVTGGGASGSSDYIAAAITSDNKTIIAYTPVSQTVTVDMSKISGDTAQVRWFNPSDGSTELIGSFETAGLRDFSPKSSGDWVLLLDDASSDPMDPGDGAPITDDTDSDPTESPSDTEGFFRVSGGCGLVKTP